MATKRDGLYKRGPFWWLRSDPVTKKPKSTQCRNIEAARRFRTTRERLAADPANAAAQTARLDKWIARVIAKKTADGKAEGTLQVYRQKLGHFIRLEPKALMADISPEFVDRYVATRRTEEVSDHTISKEVTHLLTVVQAAKRARQFAGDVDTLRPDDLHAGYKPRKRALTRAEVNRLIPELNPTLGALVAVCVSLGCRLSEAFRLRPSDIDFERNQVWIAGTKTELAARFVPILSIFRGLLERAVPALPLGASAPNNMRRDIRAACKRAGIAPCTTNDFRRTNATMLSEAGVDRDVTRRLLGHTTTKLVDLVYGQPSTDALGALAEAKLLTAAPVQGRYIGTVCTVVSDGKLTQFDGKLGADFET